MNWWNVLNEEEYLAINAWCLVTMRKSAMETSLKEVEERACYWEYNLQSEPWKSICDKLALPTYLRGKG
jgi:hypothetical protein